MPDQLKFKSWEILYKSLYQNQTANESLSNTIEHFPKLSENIPGEISLDNKVTNPSNLVKIALILIGSGFLIWVGYQIVKSQNEKENSKNK